MTGTAWMLTRTMVLAAVLALSASAYAVQVQDLVRLKGGETSKIATYGLVVGLNGTGDGGDYAPAMRPLAEVIKHFIDPNTVESELRDTENVALVYVSATIPATGVREGDLIDVSVSSVGAAESLVGGRLFLTPMKGPLRDSGIFAFAEGPVTVENDETPTVGVIRGGAQLTRDIFARYLHDDGTITLVLKNAVASVPMANNLANKVNELLSPDGSTVFAIAMDGRNVVVQVPEYERANLASFISQILLTDIDPTLIPTGARVVINEKTGTIVVSGDVEVSPVIIMHGDLTITTVTPPIEPTPELPRVEDQPGVPMDPGARGGAQLADLLQAFNQLKVPAKDRIAILRELERSGKLHATLIEEATR